MEQCALLCISGAEVECIAYQYDSTESTCKLSDASMIEEEDINDPSFETYEGI